MNKNKLIAKNWSFDLSGLDFEDIGSWPVLVKFLVVFFLILLVNIGGYFFYIKDFQQNILNEKNKELQLKSEFSRLINKAINKTVYEAQLKVVEKKHKELVQKLPTRKEIPSLLEGVSKTGHDAGLFFRIIDMKPEKNSDYYMELPISIEASGGYHEIASFISGVSNLPRIITVQDFSIKEIEKSALLNLKLSCKTFTYKD